MSSTVDQAFVQQFEMDVHLAFQRQGSKLRNTVRTQTGVRGSSTTFQKIGQGLAQQKSRHGQVPPMNADHSAVACAMQDWYAGDWVDRLDEIKIDKDEKAALAQTGAFALGRKADDLIITELDKTTVEAATTAGGLTLDKVKEAFEILGANDIPFDGDLWAVVGFKQWNDLLSIPEFASSDFVTDSIFTTAVEAKRWMGTIWMPHTGLPLDAASTRSCFWFHKRAAGHAIGAEVTTDISWHGDHAAHFVNNYMSMGACLIQEEGVVRIKAAEV